MSENSVKQLTEEQALAFAEGGSWQAMSPAERGHFQLYQDRLCMPFDKFHEGLEKLLGRPMWTHELCDPDSLRREAEGKRPAPTMQEIVDLIPAEKRVVVVAR